MAKIVSKQVMEDIRSRSDIVQVVGSYFNLQRAGSSFKALCPFHKEKTPSFHVNPQRQIYHCFGCGAGGDVFRFVMQYENVDFMGAVRMLAQRAGVPLEFEAAEDPGGADKSVLYKIHAEVAALYHGALRERQSAEVARRYLAGRGLEGEIVEEFQLGYAPDRWDALLEWARRNRYTLEQMELAGLVLRRAEGGAAAGWYDRFRHRLMFPIADEQGRVIGFSARCLEQDPKAAKYVNSPETPLFRKSRVLYALDKARRPIVESREAILCEGQIDVIRCHQAGFRTAVAAQGTAFTEEHVRILKRYADSVCVVFDADRAGQDAAMRGATVFMDAGLAVRIATLPPREDPDSFIRKQGAEGFRALLDQAVSAVAFQIGVLSARENVRTEVGLMRVARPVLDMITHCPHAVQRAKLVQEAAERLGLPAGALQEDLRRLLRPSRAGGRAQEEPPAAPAHPAEEVSLCEHLVHGGDTPALAELVRKYLPLEVISDPVCRVLADACLRAAEAGQELQEALSGEEDPSGEIQRLGAQVQLAPAKITGREYSREDAVKDLILFLWRRRFEKERAELARQAEAGGDRRIEARRRQITSHLHHLRRWADGAPIIEVESA